MYVCVCGHMSMFIVWLLVCVLMQLRVCGDWGLTLSIVLNLPFYILRQEDIKLNMELDVLAALTILLLQRFPASAS